MAVARGAVADLAGVEGAEDSAVLAEDRLAVAGRAEAGEMRPTRSHE